MKIIVVSATEIEISLLKKWVAEQKWENISFQCSGVGIMQSCFSIQQTIITQQPTVMIQIGIAGSFDAQYTLGDVVFVEKEYLGSCGVNENGQWHDVFDLNLTGVNESPFATKALANPHSNLVEHLHLKKVNAITVDEITTIPTRIKQLKEKYNCAVESMEGAPFHYCGLQYNIPFVQLRGISNKAGERDKKNWQIKEAIENVNKKTFALLKQLLNK